MKKTTFVAVAVIAIILGIVFLSIGLGNLISWAVVGPLILIAIGAIILLRGMRWWT